MRPSLSLNKEKQNISQKTFYALCLQMWITNQQNQQFPLAPVLWVTRHAKVVHICGRYYNLPAHTLPKVSQSEVRKSSLLRASDCLSQVDIFLPDQQDKQSIVFEKLYCACVFH